MHQVFPSYVDFSQESDEIFLYVVKDGAFTTFAFRSASFNRLSWESDSEPRKSF